MAKQRSMPVLIMLCLFILTACNAAEPAVTASSTQSVSAESTPATAAASADAGIDNTKTGIGVIHQEYGDRNVVEILNLSYDGHNPEIELINTEISAGPLKIYQDFMDGRLENEYAEDIDVRSYAFDEGELVQIVTTCIVFPETQPDLYSKVWSYNFSRADNRRLRLDDMLDEYGLTSADIERKVRELYTPSYDETIFSVKPAGFLINLVPAKPVTHFLLEVTLEFESDPVVSFFMYTPEPDELEELNPFDLFDSDRFSMAELDPPLLYGSDNDEFSSLRLTIDTDGLESLDESSYMLDSLLFAELISYPPPADGLAYTEETLAARIKEIEGDAIHISSIARHEELSTKLSYPVWRIDYIAGSNEDTTNCADLFVNTDTGEYRVHTSVSIDWEEDYHDEIERILSSVDLAE